MWKNRPETEARLHALIADFLDSLALEVEDELDLGVVAIVAEVKQRRTPEAIEAILTERKRPEAAYTPEVEWAESIWYRCSDLRDFVASGLFRHASLLADGITEDGGDEDERGNGEAD
jgi:hypothetical protein